MDYKLQFGANIAMEATMLLILSFLLITQFFQKNRFRTSTPLAVVTGALIILIANQIILYSFWLEGYPAKYGVVSLLPIYIIDYTFAYVLSIAFFFYVQALIKDGCAAQGKTHSTNPIIIWVMVIWGVISTTIYSVSVFNPNIFNIVDGLPVYDIWSYVFVRAIIIVPLVFTFASLIHYQNFMQKGEWVLLLIFMFLPSFLSVFDDIIGISVSYVLTAFFVLILFIRIDIQRGYLIQKQERDVAELQTQIMLSQMQPHFLYNVLGTISGLCEMEGAMEARDVANRFADYFRMNLDALGKDRFIPFEKELEHIQTYLSLEKIRFEENLNIVYDIQETSFQVPSLTIQPLVENAVKHGVQRKETPGTITLRTYDTAKYYVIEIIDDGIGFDPNVEPRDFGRSHVGLSNVQTRLDLLCHGKMKIKSKIGVGTTVTVFIPKV